MQPVTISPDHDAEPVPALQGRADHGIAAPRVALLQPLFMVRPGEPGREAAVGLVGVAGQHLPGGSTEA